MWLSRLFESIYLVISIAADMAKPPAKQEATDLLASGLLLLNRHFGSDDNLGVRMGR